MSHVNSNRFHLLKICLFWPIKGWIEKRFCVQNAEFMCNELFTLLETLTLDDCAFVKGSVHEKCKGVSAYGEKLTMVIATNLSSVSVASIRRKLLKATFTEECSIHTNSKNCNTRLGL